ncbi:hypothetical protein ACP3WF_23865, partial [Salmonella enterica]|uniref:hypothetical protein n=1 Tax=Salmonella enterica TaxID=28901 RepID=UPI003CEA0FEE
RNLADLRLFETLRSAGRRLGADVPSWPRATRLTPVGPCAEQRDADPGCIGSEDRDRVVRRRPALPEVLRPCPST